MNSYWVELLGAKTYQLRGRYATRIIEAGEGEPLLLLHGTGGHAENYIYNIMPLARRFHVYAMDFLWHGASQTDGFEPEIIPKLADQVIDVLDTLNIEKTHLEGQSLGGWVAMHLALRHPGRLQKLVLTTTQGYRPDPGSIPGFVEPDPKKSQTQSMEILRDPTFEGVRTRLARVLANPECLPEEAIAVRHKFYNDPAVNRAQQQLVSQYPDGEALARFIVTDAMAAQIKAPTLVYWGDKNVTPPSLGRRLATVIPNARFVSAPNTGHWAQFESHDLHNREVMEFLSGAAEDVSRQSATAAVAD
ncbi:MAG: Alpha/beta hydrolase [Noviherbaspirillum sp.]|jgi:2-hydroxy-6-oxonona-2,4-dienedioate hydrolase|nr:Alpha/beta hydrolase [Noviherbaspirillum sp.]MDB5794179.1 Alpha/beta hydrolase [Noviherbaspirillum sp.]